VGVPVGVGVGVFVGVLEGVGVGVFVGVFVGVGVGVGVGVFVGVFEGVGVGVLVGVFVGGTGVGVAEVAMLLGAQKSCPTRKPAKIARERKARGFENIAKGTRSYDRECCKIDVAGLPPARQGRSRTTPA
jgi:hypothetical protein